MVAQNGEGLYAPYLERGILREGMGLGGTGGVWLGSVRVGVVEVEGHDVRPDGAAGEPVPVLLGERVAVLAWMEGRDVVEHGEGARGDGSGADAGTRIVLETEAECDVEQLGTGRRLREIVG